MTKQPVGSFKGSRHTRQCDSGGCPGNEGAGVAGASKRFSSWTKGGAGVA